ncbi:MAG: RrF2 family transcriptional regulator [Chloroflexota bacterium]
MHLTTRVRYGLRAMLDLALHQEEAPVLLRDIAARQGVSLAYLEQLVGSLAAGGLVMTTRGPHGGVSLLRPPREIKVSEIVSRLEGPISLVNCVKHPDICSRSDVCVTRDLWQEMQEAMAGMLDRLTLEDLVERQKRKGVSTRL